MANANENPELENGFCTEGTVIDIPESLRLLGVTPENPTIHGHVINKLFKMIFENLNHQKKKAISFWESDEYYEATANNIDICRRNNKIYFCKQTHNDTGNAPKDPATNPDYWTVLYDLDKPLFDEFAKYALKNGSASNLFKVKDAENDDEAVSLSQMNTALENVETSVSIFEKPNKNSVLFTKDSPSSIVIPAGLIVKVGDVVVKREADFNLSLETGLDTGLKVAGKDYYVYARQDGTFVLSANATAPQGYTTATTRKIGGFHYGLTGESEVLPSNALKTEADMVKNRGIKAYSMWDLTWKPANKRPEGKVLVNELFWRDIYPADEDYAIRGYSSCFALDGTTPAKLAGGAESYGRKFPKVPLSKGGNGTINYGSLTWYEANEIVSEVGMRMISYDEFSNSSYGVVEQKSLQELGYTTGTGVIQHYPELESKWGVEMAVGVQYYWGGQILNGYGSTDFEHRSDLTDGRGQIYATSNSPVATRLGGYELGTSTTALSGSRTLVLSSYVWRPLWNVGFVAVCDHLNLDK